MPDIPLTTGLQGRPRVGLPPLRLVNAYSEASPGGPTAAMRTARPGLDLLYTNGAGPVFRIYQQPGLFNNSLPFIVSGSALYQGSTFVGNVAYGQFPRMAAANSQLAIISGGGLYNYNGTVFKQVQFFSDGVSRLPSFQALAVLYNIFLFSVAGSQQFFFSSVGDPTTINAANFSSAQVNPDYIVEFAVLGEELYIFKARSVEIWDFNGSLTAPFNESPGRTYAKGCASQNGVRQVDNALIWVGDDYDVYRTGIVPQAIGSPWVRDRLKNAGAVGISQLTAFDMYVEGHAFYGFNLPLTGESYVYDCATKEWAQWGTTTSVSGDPGAFIGGTSGGQGDATVFGDAGNGNVYYPNPKTNTDNGVSRATVVSGALWRAGGVVRCNVVALRCVRGVGTSAVPVPVVAMRYSDDGGHTWTSWFDGELGQIGQYKWKASWRYLGSFYEPGRVFEWRVNDAVNFTVEGATINESRI
jgi:hypothetical protein